MVQPIPTVPAHYGRQAQPRPTTGTATVVFGVISLLSVPIYPLLPVGLIGSICSASSNRRKVMQYWGIQIGAILAGVPIALGIVNWNDRHIYDPTTSPIVVLLWVMLGFCALVYWAGGIGVILEGRRARAASMAAAASAPTNPVGFTTDGRPIYPVVGYTPDGQPVTADRAVGIAPPSSGTNGLAIASLITAFAIPLVGVTLGFVARAQINRTGQDGGGLALAGIIIGILGTVGSIVGVVMVIAALNGTL